MRAWTFFTSGTRRNIKKKKKKCLKVFYNLKFDMITCFTDNAILYTLTTFNIFVLINYHVFYIAGGLKTLLSGADSRPVHFPTVVRPSSRSAKGWRLSANGTARVSTLHVPPVRCWKIQKKQKPTTFAPAKSIVCRHVTLLGLRVTAARVHAIVYTPCTVRAPREIV